MNLFSIIDFLAVCAGALGGAAEAARDEGRDYDIIGLLGIGLVTALGGGITRDVLIGHGAPLALVDVRYLGFALAGSLLGMLMYAEVNRIATLLVVIDAAAIGLYAIAGSTRAVNAGLSWLPALLLGVITAAGGGAMRDVITGRMPQVLRPGRPYVLVALASSAVFLCVRAAGVLAPVATVAGCLTGFILRMLGMRYGWKTTPIGWRSQSGNTGD